MAGMEQVGSDRIKLLLLLLLLLLLPHRPSCVRLCVCVCVCVWERERERERDRVAYAVAATAKEDSDWRFWTTHLKLCVSFNSLTDKKSKGRKTNSKIYVFCMFWFIQRRIHLFLPSLSSCLPVHSHEWTDRVSSKLCTNSSICD